MSRAKPRPDLYAEITAKLVAAIEADPGKPQMPWRRSNAPLWIPVNATTAKPYCGINVVSLWAAAETKGFGSNEWATYRQWAEAGAQVRKGEKSSLIVKYGEYEVDPDGEEDDGKRLYLRGYNVFNAAQVDGWTPAAAPAPLPPVERIAAAEAYFAATGAQFIYGGERAFYRPSTDSIHMPDDTLWTGTTTMTAAESHAAVKAHELVHWSGHPSRCDRQLTNRFGDKAYCAEELIAEIGSCLLAAKLGITADLRPDHAQYLALYLELMKADSKAIFTAAAAAQRAIEFLDGLQPSGPAPDRPPDDPDPRTHRGPRP
jgi:antirestriction protein ArdC